MGFVNSIGQLVILGYLFLDRITTCKKAAKYPHKLKCLDLFPLNCTNPKPARSITFVTFTFSLHVDNVFI